MSQSEQQKQQQKVVQYLNEAHATEHGARARAAVADRDDAARVLPHRARAHLGETRDHAERVGRACRRWATGRNPLTRSSGVVETVVGQALALGKTPFDLLRGSGGEEKVLKNAKDACATEALEIATYTALERLADRVGDDADRQAGRVDPGRRGEDAPARPARDPEADRRRRRRRRQGQRLLRHRHHGRRRDRPRGRRGDQAGRAQDDAPRPSAPPARPARSRASPRPRARSRAPSPSESDLAIARYDSLTADEITGRLTELSQIDLAKVDSYERRHQNRTTVLSRITTLRGDEPWPGYDELTAAEVQAVLSEGDDDRAQQVRAYERAHKNRAGVLKAAEREHSNA